METLLELFKAKWSLSRAVPISKEKIMFHTKIILLVLICVCLTLSCAQNQCGKCLLDNELLCVDKSTYRWCMNGEPTSELLKCPEGQVCTNSTNACAPESETTKPICDSDCNKCPTDGSKYTCVSKTQYGRCIDNKVAYVSACESGSICSTEILLKSGQICAPSCVVNFFRINSTCKNDRQITTTLAPPTTPNVEALKTTCNAIEQSERIYYVKNDNECRTYIYCEKTGDDVQAILMKCPSGFYDVNLNTCVTERPESCVATPKTI